MGELQGRISFLFAANQFLLCNALLFFDCFFFSAQQKKMRCTKKKEWVDRSTTHSAHHFEK
jgi:hypothetical protein